MAADFNAGSIEGTLELNNAPFKAGLAEARLQAAQFEGKKVSAKAGLDKAEFDAKKTTAETELKGLGHEKAEPSVGLNISDFMAKYAILSKVLNPGGLSGDGKGILGASLGVAKTSALVGGVMSLIAALGPLSGVLAGVGVAGVTAFGGIAVSMGLFGAAVKSAMGEITKANKAGVQLTGWAGTAQKALKGLTTEWHNLINSAHAGVMKDLALAFNMLAVILPKLSPLLRVTAQGVGSILRALNAVAHSSLFDQFLSSLEKFMHGFLAGAGPVLANLLKAFMGAFIQLTPLLDLFGHALERGAAAVERFATGQGLHTFVGYVSHALPPVIGLVGSLIHALFNIGRSLAPLAGPALHFIGALVTAIGHLHFGPVAQGVGDMLTALEPLLPVLGHLINVLLKPLGQLLSALAKGPVHTLTHGIGRELRPAFKALSGILHDLVKPLAAFMGSIANLANPTGVKLVTKLLEGLQGIVHQLAGPVGKLAVALESVVDNGLSLIIPLLPSLGKGLGVVAQVLTPVVEGFASLLSHKAVVGVILGLVLAFKGLQIIAAIAKAWVFFNDALAIFLTLSEAEGIMAGIAAVSPALAAGLDLVGAAMDVALGPVGLIIIGIAAVAAGLIYAYKHSKTFRDIVNGAFTDVKHIAGDVLHWFASAISTTVDFVRSHWQLLLAIITGPIGAAVIFLITHWAEIKSGFSTLMSDVGNIVSTGIGDVVGFFTSLPGKILALDGMFLHAGVSLMQAIFHGLESAATAVGGFAANIAGSIWHELETVLNNILPHTLSINKGPIHINVPLFPHLASGGVTDGPMNATIGDNPGGREAVIPLDKYDIPKRGEVALIAAGAHADNAKIIGLLGTMVQYLAKGTDHEALAQALGEVIGKNSDAQTRRMIQAARAM